MSINYKAVYGDNPTGKIVFSTTSTSYAGINGGQHIIYYPVFNYNYVVATAGGNGESYLPEITEDGEHIVFASKATNLEGNGGSAGTYYQILVAHVNRTSIE